MKRTQVGSGAVWENHVGYSRAVRIGPYIEVSGSVAVDEQGAVVGPGDPYAQAHYILGKIMGVLEYLGAGPEQVIRTRMYVTDIRHWEEVGRAHGQFFGESRPATSMVEVSKLIGPDYLVEIEATAIATD